MCVSTGQEALHLNHLSLPCSSCTWQNFPVLQISLPPSMCDSALRNSIIKYYELYIIILHHCYITFSKWTKNTRIQNNSFNFMHQFCLGSIVVITLIFLPSMVVMSASLPTVKELVTDLPGVLEVITKSLPLCLISVIGLMSFAILMTSSGSSVDKTSFVLIPAQLNLKARMEKCLCCEFYSHPWPWGTPRSSPESKPAMFRWIPCFLEGLGSPSAKWAGGCDRCVKLNTMWRAWGGSHLLILEGKGVPGLMGNE